MFPFLSFIFLFYFFQMSTYTIHTAPHNATLFFNSSNEYVGHVCRIQVHIASYFPVTWAYCHQRPNSWNSDILAESTCCPELHRSCCLFWFYVIIYCLQCELCSFKEKKKVWLMFSSLSMHNKHCWSWAMKGGLSLRVKGLHICRGGSIHREKDGKHNHIWKLYNISRV